MEEMGIWIPLNQLNDFQQYTRLVNIETRKHLNRLFDEWDGCCYYEPDNILLIDKKSFNDPNYWNVDHKISKNTDF